MPLVSLQPSTTYTVTKSLSTSPFKHQYQKSHYPSGYCSAESAELSASWRYHYWKEKKKQPNNTLITIILLLELSWGERAQENKIMYVPVCLKDFMSQWNHEDFSGLIRDTPSVSLRNIHIYTFQSSFLVLKIGTLVVWPTVDLSAKRHALSILMNITPNTTCTRSGIRLYFD